MVSSGLVLGAAVRVELGGGVRLVEKEHWVEQVVARDGMEAVREQELGC